MASIFYSIDDFWAIPLAFILSCGLLTVLYRNIKHKDVKKIFILHVVLKAFCYIQHYYVLMLDSNQSADIKYYHRIIVENRSTSELYKTVHLGFNRNFIVELFNSLQVGFVNISSVLSLMFGTSMIAYALWLTYVSTVGFFLIYKAILVAYKEREIEAALACFLVPSCVYFTSCLGKEPLLVLGFGLIIWSATKLQALLPSQKLNILLLALGLTLVLCIKSYVTVGILIGAIAGGLSLMRASLKKRIIVASILLILCVTIVIGASDLQKVVYNFVEYYTRVNGNGLVGYASSFLGMTPLQLLLQSPNVMLNVLLFPLRFHTDDINIFAVSIENLCCLTLIVLSAIKFQKTTIEKGFLYTFTLFFTLSMALIIGYTTFNYGSMIRYRIVSQPLLFFFLLAMSGITKNSFWKRQSV